MQVTYAFGTAAEDLFSAYIYTVVPLEMYQSTTSYVKTSALLSCILSGVLGDILVTQFDTSLYTLTVISAVFVIAGAFLGFFVIRNPSKTLPSAEDSDASDDAVPLKVDQSISSQSTLRAARNSTPPLRAVYEWLAGTWAAADWATASRYLVGKYQILYLQLCFTLTVVSARDVRILTAYWIVGNGVYTVGIFFLVLLLFIYYTDFIYLVFYDSFCYAILLYRFYMVMKFLFTRN